MQREGIDWELIDKGCPHCGARVGGPQGLHYHVLTFWCLRCKTARNWVDWWKNGRKL